MLVRIPNDSERFFFLLKEAILKNTVRPRPEEEDKITVSKLIRCSPQIEGDSQLGIMLFCGIASVGYGCKSNEIMEYLGIEQNEFNYKLKKFIENYRSAQSLKPLHSGIPFDILSGREFDLRKLKNKVSMVNNYISLYAKQHSILFKKRR